MSLFGRSKKDISRRHYSNWLSTDLPLFSERVRIILREQKLYLMLLLNTGKVKMLFLK